MTPASLESESSRGYYPGVVLGNRYELVSLLGQGGTGVVWVAQDRVLNLEVAVKLMLVRESPQDDSVRRAQLEARSAARLSHPAVCRAMDFGVSAYGDPFIVSERLGGESLDEWIEREGRMEATHAVRVLLPILDALRAAHESGIVHRDVKPANIFLAGDGARSVQPKLLDFGIAHWLGDGRANCDGIVCGTPEYMSPEQASGSEGLDARSDLWNFCATLYEVVTGVVPFRGGNCNAILWAVQTADAEPITAFCAGDDGLAAIVARGLRRGRDERWQSAGDLADELGRWLLARGVETDICERSLRARLVQGSEGESGHEASYAHVVPSAVRRGGSFGKRLAIAAAAGTVLIALASSFQALRADDQAFAGAAPAAAPATTEVGPLRTNQGTAPSNAVSAPSSPALPPARTEPPRSGGSGPASASQKAGVARAAEPPASARRRPRNALNYDFGL